MITFDSDFKIICQEQIKELVYGTETWVNGDWTYKIIGNTGYYVIIDIIVYKILIIQILLIKNQAMIKDDSLVLLELIVDQCKIRHEKTIETGMVDYRIG